MEQPSCRYRLNVGIYDGCTVYLVLSSTAGAPYFLTAPTPPTNGLGRQLCTYAVGGWYTYTKLDAQQNKAEIYLQSIENKSEWNRPERQDRGFIGGTYSRTPLGLLAHHARDETI